MMDQAQTQPASLNASRFLPVLLILFFGSGCAALIYEIVWYHFLQLAIGSSAVSLGVLLATFMGGLCLGSLALPRLGWVKQHPLRVYAVIELGIALFAVLVLAGVPLIDRVYIAGAEHGLPSMLLRSLFAAVCLLPPTILMGASLPAMSRWIKATPRGASWWGLLYGANTAGAVFGCLLAGFYLLRLYNTAVATFAGAAINVLVALVSLAVAAKTPHRVTVGDPEEAGPATEEGQGIAESGESRWPVYVTIGLSGACALGAEVIWTRVMGMMLGSTVYVFSIILAVFLVGLAIGTGVGIVPGAHGAAAAGAGLVSDSSHAGDLLGVLHDVQFAALLAGRSISKLESLVQLPGGPGALPVGHAAPGDPLRRELPAGPGGGGEAGRRSRAVGGQRVRRQHPRRHCGRPEREPGAGRLDRNAVDSEAAAADGGAERAVRARAIRLEALVEGGRDRSGLLLGGGGAAGQADRSSSGRTDRLWAQGGRLGTPVAGHL